MGTGGRPPSPSPVRPLRRRQGWLRSERYLPTVPFPSAGRLSSVGPERRPTRAPWLGASIVATRSAQVRAWQTYHDSRRAWMKWVTSRDVRVEGVACPWLITRFIDDDAEFGFVPPDEVLTVAAREQGLAFGVQGAPYAAADGRSTFDALIAQHGIVAPGLDALA